jgi:phospholipid/cholesterol/gamma-HCH transport system substrate-binding protein
MNTIESAKRLLGGAPRSPKQHRVRLGVVLYVSLAIIFALLFLKPDIQTMLNRGEVLKAEFSSSYKMRPGDSTVKVAGVTVGTVTKIEHTDRGTALVTMKIDGDALETLGSKPTAHIEPRTILGGRYAVEITQGGGPGAPGDDIPLARTTTPVEADTVLEALPGKTRESLQGTVRKLDKTLAGASSKRLRSLVSDLPRTLEPTGEVLTAVQGTRPGKDLPQLVDNLQKLSSTLTSNDGQLDDIVVTLDQTADALAAQRQPLERTLNTLPATLTETRSGLKGLGGTLDALTATAGHLEPAAPELSRVLRKLDPVLVDAKPLLDDLVPTLRDANPAVESLVPVSRNATAVLDDLQGPVLDRVNGPVMGLLNNTWKGTGHYQDSGGGSQSDHTFYEELAYMVTNVDRASMTQDRHGSLLGFQVGAGLDSVVGLPFNLDNLLELASQTVGGNRG